MSKPLDLTFEDPDESQEPRWEGMTHHESRAWQRASGPLHHMILDPYLATAKLHDVLLTKHRQGFIAARLQFGCKILTAATLLWIPLDFLLFSGLWGIILPLTLMRLIAASIFWYIGYSASKPEAVALSPDRSSGVKGVAATIAIGCIFYLLFHMLLVLNPGRDPEEFGHAHYVLLPIAMVAGIGIFPLTIREALALAFPPILLMGIEVFCFKPMGVWINLSPIIPLAIASILATGFCAASQLRMLIDLHQQSIIDPLTGLLSRGAGSRMMQLLYESASRSGEPLVVLFIDLDRFKMINDLFGHAAGDDVLRKVAALLNEGKRGQDALIRWGGEEFLLVLPRTNIAGASVLIQRLFGTGLSTRPDGSVQTASIGGAERVTDGAMSWEALVDQADKRLYTAKAMGRNRLVLPGQEYILTDITTRAGGKNAGQAA